MHDIDMNPSFCVWHPFQFTSQLSAIHLPSSLNLICEITSAKTEELRVSLK
jgi:hypothetical protein